MGAQPDDGSWEMFVEENISQWGDLCGILGSYGISLIYMWHFVEGLMLKKIFAPECVFLAHCAAEELVGKLAAQRQLSAWVRECYICC
jgi:hypothetical protein